jgi:hypothetical protein
LRAVGVRRPQNDRRDRYGIAFRSGADTRKHVQRHAEREICVRLLDASPTRSAAAIGSKKTDLSELGEITIALL